MKENVHFSLRNTGVPPRRALHNEHFPLKKVGNAETTKMDHFRMYTFSKKNWGAALYCVVFSGPECLVRMFVILLGIRGAARAALLFPKARSKLFQNVHYSLGKKRGAAREHPRATCERPARTSFQEKRDKYLQTEMEKREERGEREGKREEEREGEKKKRREKEKRKRKGKR